MVDFNRKRAIVRANTSFIKGRSLDEIDPGHSGFHPAMVLIHKDWNNVYFVSERKDWDDADYFDFAEERFKELRIVRP